MNRVPLVFALALVVVSAVAQTTMPMLKSVAPVAAPQAQTQLPMAEVDKDAVIKRLRDQNAQLRKENAELKARIESMTVLGGSEVHAYCSSSTTSRNTAGAEFDCSASGYTCEPVSGLCRTIVRSSDECAPGYLMDVDHCVRPPSGE